MVMQRTANPWMSVRFRSRPPRTFSDFILLRGVNAPARGCLNGCSVCGHWGFAKHSLTRHLFLVVFLFFGFAFRAGNRGVV